MPRPSETVDTDEGKLELVRLAAGDWLITIDRRTLMSSRQHGSEVALAEMACRPLSGRSAPRVLVAGLGMGYTLRAALDALPADAEVVTAELNSTVARWNRGPIASLSGNALADARIRLEIIDVSVLIARASTRGLATGRLFCDLVARTGRGFRATAESERLPVRAAPSDSQGPAPRRLPGVAPILRKGPTLDRPFLRCVRRRLQIPECGRRVQNSDSPRILMQ